MALADEQISKVTTIVNSKLGTVRGWAAQAQAAAATAIDAVGLLEPPNVEIQFPVAPVIGEPVEPSALAFPNATIANEPASAAFSGNAPPLTFEKPADIPSPVYGSPVAVPDRPNAAPPAPPTQYPTVAANTDVPDLPDLAVPATPTLDIPDPPDLISIDIPELTELADIEPFSEAPPEYSGEQSKMEGLIAKVEQLLVDSRDKLTAASESFAALQANKGASLTTGFLQLNADRAKRMRQQEDEAAAIVDREVLAKTKEARAIWASRNFSLVPGMLVDQVNELEIEGGRKIREASSKINQTFIKMAKEEFDKVMSIYIALEQNLLEYNLEVARRFLEEEKIRVRAQIELFNSVLELHKAKQSTVNAHIEAFRAQKQFSLERIGTYKTAVDGAVAKTAENEARIRIYGTQVQSLKTQTELYKSSTKAVLAPIEAYKAQLIGIKANADTAVANVQSYREAIKGYAAAVDAATAEVGAYAAQVQANSSVTGIEETNIRAYSEYIQQAVRSSSVYKTFAAEQSELLSAYLQTFREAAATNESFVRAQSAKVTAETQLTSAKVSAYEAYMRNFSSYNKALAEKTAAMMSHSMTSAENAARAQALINQAQSETDKVTAGALAAKAQALAGLAQGAMSALHVSASAQGTGSTASSYGYGISTTSNWGGTTSRSETKSQSLGA